MERFKNLRITNDGLHSINHPCYRADARSRISTNSLMTNIIVPRKSRMRASLSVGPEFLDLIACQHGDCHLYSIYTWARLIKTVGATVGELMLESPRLRHRQCPPCLITHCDVPPLRNANSLCGAGPGHWAHRKHYVGRAARDSLREGLE